MQLICEIFVNKYLPSIRALIAKKLVEEYKLTQQEVATRLYLTQGAVSQYVKHIRGKEIEKLNENVLNKIDEICNVLSLKILTKQELHKIFCEICKLIQSDSLKQTQHY